MPDSPLRESADLVIFNASPAPFLGSCEIEGFSMTKDKVQRANENLSKVIIKTLTVQRYRIDRIHEDFNNQAMLGWNNSKLNRNY